MNTQKKKRLFIVAGTFTTAIAAALIKQLKLTNDDNYLVSIAPLLYENLDSYTKAEADKLNLFKETYFFFDFCPPKQNFKDEKSHIFSFDVKKFKYTTNNIEFDEIYSIYIHGAANHLFNQYPNADLYFMEDGTATYLKMENASRINKRAKKIYTLNFFDKIKPHVSLYEGLKTEQIDKNILKSVFEELAEKTPFSIEQKDKSIIFCAQNISINPKAMTFQDELNLYAKNISKLINDGYFIYFKEHPKTPNLFYSKLKEIINSPNMTSLGEYNVLPVEILLPLLRPFAVVSMFSSALLTAPWIFNVPTFTFFADNEFKNHQIFGIAHMLVAIYIPPIESLSSDTNLTTKSFELFLKNSPKIENNGIYRIKLIDFFKIFISKHEFKKVQKDLKNTHKFLLKYSNLPPNVIDLFENQTYTDYLLFYFEHFNRQCQLHLNKLRNEKSSFKKVFTLILRGLKILTQIIF